MIENLKPFIKIPVWVVLFPFRLIVALLNLVPLPWIYIVRKEIFLKWLPAYGQSCPVQYIVTSNSRIHFGYWLVAWIRGLYQKYEIYKIEKIYLDEEGVKQNHKVVEKFLKNAVLEEDLRMIRNDFRLVKHCNCNTT